MLYSGQMDRQVGRTGSFMLGGFQLASSIVKSHLCLAVTAERCRVGLQCVMLYLVMPALVCTAGSASTLTSCTKLPPPVRGLLPPMAATTIRLSDDW